jgi:uncharacterized protein CbrC (UPF0167 family)
MSELPQYRYHPAPLETGSIVHAAVDCVCCGERKPYTYTGPAYAVADIGDQLCPWCVASGAAHDRFGAEFTDAEALLDEFTRSGVVAPADVIREVAWRTPGFSGWQQERWLVHCGDACAFLGPAGQAEVASYGSADLLDSLRRDMEMEAEEFAWYLNHLDRDHGPTAYIFQCLHCSLLLGYSDST